MSASTLGYIASQQFATFFWLSIESIWDQFSWGHSQVLLWTKIAEPFRFFWLASKLPFVTWPKWQSSTRVQSPHNLYFTTQLAGKNSPPGTLTPKRHQVSRAFLRHAHTLHDQPCGRDGLAAQAGSQLPEDLCGAAARAAWVLLICRANQTTTVDFMTWCQVKLGHFTKVSSPYFTNLNYPVITLLFRWVKFLFVGPVVKPHNDVSLRRALSHTGLKRLAIGLETALLMDSPKAEAAHCFISIKCLCFYSY